MKKKRAKAAKTRSGESPVIEVVIATRGARGRRGAGPAESGACGNGYVNVRRFAGCIELLELRRSGTWTTSCRIAEGGGGQVSVQGITAQSYDGSKPASQEEAAGDAMRFERQDSAMRYGKQSAASIPTLRAAKLTWLGPQTALLVTTMQKNRRGNSRRQRQRLSPAAAAPRASSWSGSQAQPYRALMSGLERMVTIDDRRSVMISVELGVGVGGWGCPCAHLVDVLTRAGWRRLARIGR